MYSPPPPPPPPGPPGPYGPPGPQGPWGPQPPYPPPPRGGSGPLLPILLAGGIVVLLVVAGLVTWLVWPADESPTARRRIATVSPSPIPTNVPTEFGGTWKGDLATKASEKYDWSMSITLLSGTSSGSLQYLRDGRPTCTGTLSFSKGDPGKITMNQSTPSCDTKSAIVTMSLSGNRLFVTWYLDQSKLNVGSSAYSGILDKS